MTRNTTWRVEVAVSIEDVDLRARIQEMFITMLSDNVKARGAAAGHTYVCLTPEENAPLNSQEYFFDAAYAAAENNYFR